MLVLCSVDYIVARIMLTCCPSQACKSSAERGSEPICSRSCPDEMQQPEARSSRATLSLLYTERRSLILFYLTGRIIMH